MRGVADADMVDAPPSADEVELPLRHGQRHVEQLHRPGPRVLPHDVGLPHLDSVPQQRLVRVVLPEVPLRRALQERF